jgi:hypothetical protein
MHRLIILLLVLTLAPLDALAFGRKRPKLPEDTVMAAITANDATGLVEATRRAKLSTSSGRPPSARARALASSSRSSTKRESSPGAARSPGGKRVSRFLGKLFSAVMRSRSGIGGSGAGTSKSIGLTLTVTTDSLERKVTSFSASIARAIRRWTK